MGKQKSAHRLMVTRTAIPVPAQAPPVPRPVWQGILSVPPDAPGQAHLAGTGGAEIDVKRLAQGVLAVYVGLIMQLGAQAERERAAKEAAQGAAPAPPPPPIEGAPT